MQERRSVEPLRLLCSGPGRLTQALGISLSDNDSDLLRGPIVFGPRPRSWRDPPITAGLRIGITKAVELPWRFTVTGSRFISRPVVPAPP